MKIYCVYSVKCLWGGRFDEKGSCSEKSPIVEDKYRQSDSSDTYNNESRIIYLRNDNNYKVSTYF